MSLLSILIIVGYILLFVVAILWFFLPFAIFGFQKKLDQINKNLCTIAENQVLHLEEQRRKKT